MDTETHVVERALQIAREGGFSRVEHVRKQLTREGYSKKDLSHIAGSLAKQLIAQSKAAEAG